MFYTVFLAPSLTITEKIYLRSGCLFINQAKYSRVWGDESGKKKPLSDQKNFLITIGIDFALRIFRSFPRSYPNNPLLHPSFMFSGSFPLIPATTLFVSTVFLLRYLFFLSRFLFFKLFSRPFIIIIIFFFRVVNRLLLKGCDTLKMWNRRIKYFHMSQHNIRWKWNCFWKVAFSILVFPLIFLGLAKQISCERRNMSLNDVEALPIPSFPY